MKTIFAILVLAILGAAFAWERKRPGKIHAREESSSQPVAATDGALHSFHGQAAPW